MKSVSDDAGPGTASAMAFLFVDIVGGVVVTIVSVSTTDCC